LEQLLDDTDCSTSDGGGSIAEHPTDVLEARVLEEQSRVLDDPVTEGKDGINTNILGNVTESVLEHTVDEKHTESVSNLGYGKWVADRTNFVKISSRKPSTAVAARVSAFASSEDFLPVVDLATRAALLAASWKSRAIKLSANR
jgi:hypothetical protein